MSTIRIGNPTDWNRNLTPVDFSVADAMWIDFRGNSFTALDILRAKQAILAMYIRTDDYDEDAFSVELCPVQQGVLRVRVVESSIAGRKT